MTRTIDSIVIAASSLKRRLHMRGQERVGQMWPWSATSGVGTEIEGEETRLQRKIIEVSRVSSVDENYS
jgi:hypothetical protein